MRFLVELVVHNWTIKLAALLLAVLLWTVVKADEQTRVSVENVPIEVVMRDPGWELAAPPAPASAAVVFSGPFGELVRLPSARPRVVIPVDEVTDSVEVRQLRTGWVQLEGDMTQTSTVDIRPGAVLLTFERLTTRMLPVMVRTRGVLPPGLELAAPIRAEPSTVRVSGPQRAVEPLDSLRTAPIELGGVQGSAVLNVPLDTTGLGDLSLSQTDVDVVVRVAPVATDTLVAEPATARLPSDSR